MVEKVARKKAKTSVAVMPQAQVKQQNSTEALIQQAVASGASVETMERLFNLRKEVKAEAAKELFVEALAAFQRAVPVIEKKKKVLNNNGTLRYMYAPLDSIVEQIRDALAEQQLSYSWDSDRIEGHMRVTFKVTHKFGHFETSSFDIPIENATQYMTSPQKYASALTYAKRYTLLNGLGIATADEDTDATDTGKDSEALNPKAKIQFCLRRLNEKHSTKTEVEEAVMRLTNLPLEENNYEVIVARLETIITENYEGGEVQG